MSIGWVGVGCSVNDIAGNVLTTTECSEQMGEVKAKPFPRADRFAHIEILDEGISLKVIFKVRYDPILERPCLFRIGLTIGTNFVSKLNRLRIPQGISAIVKIWGFRFVDEVVYGVQIKNNDSRYRKNIDFRQKTVFPCLFHECAEVNYLN